MRNFNPYGIMTEKNELESRENKLQFSAAMVFFILRVQGKEIFSKLSTPTYKNQVWRMIRFFSL